MADYIEAKEAVARILEGIKNTSPTFEKKEKEKEDYDTEQLVLARIVGNTDYWWEFRNFALETNPLGSKVISIANKFIQSARERKRGNLIISAPAGTGKTSLLISIARELIKDYLGKFTYICEFVGVPMLTRAGMSEGRKLIMILDDLEVPTRALSFSEIDMFNLINSILYERAGREITMISTTSSIESLLEMMPSGMRKFLADAEIIEI